MFDLACIVVCNVALFGERRPGWFKCLVCTYPFPVDTGENDEDAGEQPFIAEVIVWLDSSVEEEDESDEDYVPDSE